MLTQNAIKDYIYFLANFTTLTPRDSSNLFFYDQAFHLVKQLTIYLTHHTTEDIQALTNTVVPMPPWGFSDPVVIPMSCCSDAAQYIIKYFGAHEVRSLLGGARWWQMRTLEGVPAEWISQKTDYHTMVDLQHGKNASVSTGMAKHLLRSSHRRNPRHERDRAFADEAMRKKGSFADTQEERDRLNRVMLYIPGGGYYFGSVNTHRFQILRIARKFGGFAFAVNYRKAPQFPFPCALQDCLAAYLYLIRPPPHAKHPAIDPSRIVIAGDSAGGGLSVALLQLLRDLDLPMPAGGVLISPWCDMTHSFPSILQNTATDYIPPYSFIHRPSTLWPLPKDTGAFENKSIFNLGISRQQRRAREENPPSSEMHRPIVLDMPNGEKMPIPSQIQFYATNGQLYHPLCSPALSGSLGGLPPLYVLAGDSEVLRDEIVYLAHKAANPDKFRLRDELMDRFPIMRASFEKYKDQPTKVHLQVFDNQCHVFTMLMKTISAKFAFRGIASFVKYVTGAPTETIAIDSPDYAEAWQYKDTAAATYTPGDGAGPDPSQVPVLDTDKRAYMYSGKVPLQRPEYRSNMIRERVDVRGKVRAMEPPSELPSLTMPYQDVGRVKAKTYNRFQEGHTIWDNRYKHTASRVQRQRAKNEARARKIYTRAQAEGLLEDKGDLDLDPESTVWTGLATYGPADLVDEMPPPTSIVGRRDTPDALDMLQHSLQQRAKRRLAAGLMTPTAPSPRLFRPRGMSLADEEPHFPNGEHRPTAEPGEPLSKRFGLLKRLLFPFGEPGPKE